MLRIFAFLMLIGFTAQASAQTPDNFSGTYEVLDSNEACRILKGNWFIHRGTPMFGIGEVLGNKIEIAVVPRTFTPGFSLKITGRDMNGPRTWILEGEQDVRFKKGKMIRLYRQDGVPVEEFKQSGVIGLGPLPIPTGTSTLKESEKMWVNEKGDLEIIQSHYWRATRQKSADDAIQCTFRRLHKTSVVQ